MKKYIAPEVEIKRFMVESIMDGSEAVTPGSYFEDNAAPTNGTQTVQYSDLFTL